LRAWPHPTIEGDCRSAEAAGPRVKLQILTEKDPDALFVFRHSRRICSRGVMDLYPNVKLGTARRIDTGFFYEIPAR